MKTVQITFALSVLAFACGAMACEQHVGSIAADASTVHELVAKNDKVKDKKDKTAGIEVQDQVAKDKVKDKTAKNDKTKKDKTAAVEAQDQVAVNDKTKDPKKDKTAAVEVLEQVAKNDKLKDKKA